MIALDAKRTYAHVRTYTHRELTSAPTHARTAAERLAPMPKRDTQDTRRILLERVRIVARRYDLPFSAVEELVEAIADIYGVCPDCARSYVRESGQQVYCPDCAAVRTREANRIAQAKRRARLKPDHPDYIDILELPDGWATDTDEPPTPHRVK